MKMLGNGILKIRYNNNIQLTDNCSIIKNKNRNNFQTQTSINNNSLRLKDFLGKYDKKQNIKFNSNSLPKISKEKIPNQINKCFKNQYSKEKYVYNLKLKKKIFLLDNQNTNENKNPNTISIKEPMNYIIGKTITYSTTGNLKKCKNKINGINYYVKIYDENEKERKYLIEKEISLIKDICHPNIIKFIKKIKIESTNYIIMEYVNGITLSSFIKNQQNKKLNEITTKRIIYQLISAISYLHKNNICHRDLKLDNILIDDKINIKLIDLGYSIYFNNNTYLNYYDGNINYLAPEIIKKKRYNGFAVDVWNIGIILYYLLCGCFPFNNNKNREEFLENNISFPDYLSFEVKELIKKMLCVNPISRITINNILRNEWLLNTINIFN